MRAVTALLIATTLAACAEEKGVCEERRVFQSVREGFCVEMDSPAMCPVAESGDDSDEFQWRWYPKGDCAEIGYDIDCGGGIWVDLETRCGGSEG